MFKLAAIVFYFIRELIFDSKKEYDFQSPHFDGRKMIFLTLLMLSLAFNWFLTIRVVQLAKTSLEDHAKIEQLYVEIKNLKEEHEIDVFTIQALINNSKPIDLQKITSRTSSDDSRKQTLK